MNGVEQLIQRFDRRITNIINYHLEKYQRDESEVDRLAKKLVPLLQECVPAAKAAIWSSPETQAPFLPNIARDHFPDEEREDVQRYSRCERDIVSDRRAEHGMGEGLLPSLSD